MWAFLFPFGLLPRRHCKLSDRMALDKKARAAVCRVSDGLRCVGSGGWRRAFLFSRACVFIFCFFKFRVPFCPLTILAEFAEEVVLRLHQQIHCHPAEATAKAIYLQRVVKGAARRQGARLQDERVCETVSSARTKPVAKLCFQH